MTATAVAARGPAVVNLSPAGLQPHPRRLRDDLGELDELTESIAAQGILVPLTVERHPAGRLVILYGHRRAAAAILAGRVQVPCIVVGQHTDEDAILAMVGTKEHRRRLTPTERQRAMKTLQHEFGMSYEQIGQKLGISVSSVYRWGQGEDAATQRGNRPPKHAGNPSTWGGKRGTRRPRIRADRVWSLVEQWRPRVSEGLNPDEAQALLAEVEDLLQQWQPEPTVTETKRAEAER